MPDARIERTRAALTSAVLRLLGERDFAAITIADIVAAAGVGYTTFFRHYEGKEELLLDASDRLTDALLPSLLPVLQGDDTRGVALAICRHVEAHGDAFAALLSAAGEPRVQRLLVERGIARAASIGLPDPPGLPPDLAIAFAVQAVQGLLSWWLHADRRLPASEMAAIIDRLVITPVRKG